MSQMKKTYLDLTMSFVGVLLMILSGLASVCGQPTSGDQSEYQCNSFLTNCERYVEEIVTSVVENKLQNVAHVEREAYDCADIQAHSRTRAASGIYTVLIGARKTPTQVYCDMDTDDGGWLVIQRRVNGSVDFYMNWSDYAKGFGQVNHEFWLGNNNIHMLTKTKPYELRIDMSDWDGLTRYALYSHFVVAGEPLKYRLESAGLYTGNAGDSLKGDNLHTGQSFSTYDQDNDSATWHCAVTYKGAWWYNACHRSNLNGEYKVGGVHTTDADGVNWYTFKGHNYSLKFVEMKIRSANYK